MDDAPETAAAEMDLVQIRQTLLAANYALLQLETRIAAQAISLEKLDADVAELLRLFVASKQMLAVVKWLAGAIVGLWLFVKELLPIVRGHG